jgi:hypothetical protein
MLIFFSFLYRYFALTFRNCSVHTIKALKSAMDPNCDVVSDMKVIEIVKRY